MKVIELGLFVFRTVVTFCTEGRHRNLLSNDIPAAIAAECQGMQNEGVWKIRCWTFMPDHVHLLVELGPRLSLGKAVARLKGRTATELRKAGLSWQSGYFDHRLRPREDVLSYFLYTYLNPYQAGLVTTNEPWPWFLCEKTDRDWFMPMLNDVRPEPEWLKILP